MDIDLRTLTTFAEAQPYLEVMTARATETLEALGAPDPEEGFFKACLEHALATDEGLVILAEPGEGGDPLGFCFVGPHTDPLSGQTTPMILVLSVTPDARHRGLAGALVQEAHRQLIRLGHSKLTARCAHGDDALISMWERWGFLREWEFLARDGM
jgi:GNAT superfamily N-acetyltransferase